MEADLDVLAGTPAMNRIQNDGHRQILIGDKNYFGAEIEEAVDKAGIEWTNPGRGVTARIIQRLLAMTAAFLAQRPNRTSDPTFAALL